MKELKIEIPKGHEIDQEKSTFERIVFKEVKKDIAERVKSVEDAIKELGENDTEVRDYRYLQSSGVSKHIIGYQGAVVFCKALNEGWVPNWDDTNEYKYYIWWDLRNDNLSCGNCSFRYFSGYTSSRLHFKNKTLAQHAGKFPEIFKDYMRM